MVVWRRFSEFVLLRNRLWECIPGTNSNEIKTK